MIRQKIGHRLHAAKAWLDEIVTTKRKHVVAIFLLSLLAFAGVLQQQSFRDSRARWDTCAGGVDVRNDLRTLFASFANLNAIFTDPGFADFAAIYETAKLADLDRLYPELSITERCGQRPHFLWFD